MRKTSRQAVEADERAAEMEERLVYVCPPLVAHRKTTVPRQPSERPLYYRPMPTTQPLARVDAALGDTGLDIALAQCLAAAGEVVIVDFCPEKV